MKASELIAELQNKIETSGDLEVVFVEDFDKQHLINSASIVDVSTMFENDAQSGQLLWYRIALLPIKIVSGRVNEIEK